MTGRHMAVLDILNYLLGGGVFLYALSKYTKMGLLKKVLTVLVIIIAIAAYLSGE